MSTVNADSCAVAGEREESVYLSAPSGSAPIDGDALSQALDRVKGAAALLYGAGAATQPATERWGALVTACNELHDVCVREASSAPATGGNSSLVADLEHRARWLEQTAIHDFPLGAVCGEIAFELKRAVYALSGSARMEFVKRLRTMVEWYGVRDGDDGLLPAEKQPEEIREALMLLARHNYYETGGKA